MQSYAKCNFKACIFQDDEEADERISEPHSLIGVLLVDDQPLMRLGLETMLKTGGTSVVLGSTESYGEALMFLQHHSVDVIITEAYAQSENSTLLLEELHKMQNPPKTIVFTQFRQDELIYQAIKAGAQGYVFKQSSADELNNAILSVYRGKSYIHGDVAVRLARRLQIKDYSRRELETISLIAQGKTNKQIAATLHLSAHTVRHYVLDLLEKLNAPDRTGAVTEAFRRGIIAIPD